MISKIIDEKCLSNHEEYQKAYSLAVSINKLHALLTEKQNQFNSSKKELTDISKNIFNEDLDKDTPEICPNHDYPVPDNLVRVNFKMRTEQWKAINKYPADKVLKKSFGDNYEKLFEDVETLELNADEETLLDHAGSHPELFDIALRDDLDIEALKNLVIDHPELVTLRLRDLNEYSKYYPGNVTKTTQVKTKSGFLEKCAKLPGDVRKKTRKLIDHIIKSTVYTAVKCGNEAK